MSLFLNLSQ